MLRSKGNWFNIRLDFCLTVHHQLGKVIQMNQLDATMIYWSVRSAQHVSGNLLPIIRSVRQRFLQHMVSCCGGGQGDGERQRGTQCHAAAHRRFMYFFFLWQSFATVYRQMLNRTSWQCPRKWEVWIHCVNIVYHGRASARVDMIPTRTAGSMVPILSKYLLQWFWRT